MSEKRFKYLFLLCAVTLFGFMLLMSRRAGVTCDEVLHYNHSVSVYNYFATFGKDKSALDTPVSHLQYYGQTYDNLVTIFIKWFHIQDIYRFRHLMSILAGWLTVVITALFAVWIAGYGAGIIALLLFAVSPTFLGHAQNNLKDIPFALGYIAGIFMILRFICSDYPINKKQVLLTILSIAFCISIRAGGLILICYLFFFMLMHWFIRSIRDRKISFQEYRKKLMWSVVISIGSYFIGILLWPYALQNPLVNPWKSYQVMLQFPDTFRQIFNGKVDWSDFMPWYYLPEYMAITIPLVVLSGLLFFILFSARIFRKRTAFIYCSLIFVTVFPVLFVIWERSNLYSAWRQFLFIYPGIILLSSFGLLHIFQSLRKRYLIWGFAVLIGILSLNPLKFMIINPEYSYIYYNQFVGGLKGAYGRFETDYYYVSLREASEWLINYLDTKKDKAPVKVMANFSVKWFFRNNPEIQNYYFRYEDRSQHDWDYAIVANRYIPLYQLVNKKWPPDNAIKVIYADNIPVCAILQRKSKDDLSGYEALEGGRTKEAIKYFEQALKYAEGDELFYFNFASALYDDGQYEKADSALKRSLEINPDFDISLMYLGNIAAVKGKEDDAILYYEKVINVNRKYFEAYVELSKLIGKSDVKKARQLLVSCLNINSQFKPAVIALADSYRISNPEVARKYDEIANKIKP